MSSLFLSRKSPRKFSVNPQGLAPWNKTKNIFPQKKYFLQTISDGMLHTTGVIKLNLIVSINLGILNVRIMRPPDF